jgi:NTE family protein
MCYKFLLFSVLSFVGMALLAQPIPNKRPKVGVVLSGGGAKGLAHIGVLKVLEKEGIPIDYIGGTSMGSIIGGLYAIGYSSAQLDSIVKAINWDSFLTDKISRRSLSMVEKDEDLKYLFSFPIKEKRISLPTGIVAGQNISRLFAQLTSPVYNVDDFSKFQIPFLCVATDVERGEAAILKKGSLAEAMRASMAIPTVFTPVDIDGKALLDGGLIDNFPVVAVKNMGADIIIGVDVGYKFYKRDELNSIVRIVEQSIFMHSMDRSQKAKEMCDILILPSLSEYNASSFAKADSLILRGEKATMLQHSKIKELADYLHSFSDSAAPKRYPAKPVADVYVNKIEISGLSNVPEAFILRKFPFDLPASIKLSEIDQFIEQMFGTWFFEKINYELEPMGDGVKLHFKVIEKNTNLFRVGLHYDNYYKTTLVLNTTFRNKLAKGSKITMDLSLGENPSLSAMYYKNTGWNPRYYFLLKSKLVPDFGLRAQAHKMEVFQYENNKKVAIYNFVDFTTDLFLQLNILNNNSLNCGLLSDYTSITNRINYSGNNSGDFYYLNLYLNYKKDSYDQAFYPSRGARMFVEAKYSKGVGEDLNSDKGFISASVRSDIAIPISKKVSLHQGIYGGTIAGDSVPIHYRYFMGGLANTYFRGVIPFVGMNFMQESGLHTWVGRIDVQWEVINDNFFLLKGNIGKTVNDRKNLFTMKDVAFGYGVGFGYRSPIGPIEINLMTSNKNPTLAWFINIGYWF